MNQPLKQMAKTAMMAAIIFVCTYTLKIPISLTGGYTHLGDCAIFLAVLFLGRRDGAIAAAIGGAMSDLLGGFLIWVLPTLAIKGLMAFVMGTVVEKLPGKRGNWFFGAALGGLCQIVGYQLTKLVLISPEAALATIPTITGQTVMGILLAAALIPLFQKSGVPQRIRQM